MLAAQIEWMNGNGGLEWAAGRCDRSAAILYAWADATQGTDRPHRGHHQVL